MHNHPQREKQPERPSTGEWIHCGKSLQWTWLKYRCTQQHGLISNRLRKSKKSQTHKATFCIIPFQWYSIKGSTTVGMENKPVVARCMVRTDYKGDSRREWGEGGGVEEAELFCILIVVEGEGRCISQNLQKCTPQRVNFTAYKTLEKETFNITSSEQSVSACHKQ